MFLSFSVGRYIYIESSYPRIPGDVARLVSSPFTKTTGNCQLRFYYNMNGYLVGSLLVKLKPQNANEQVLVNITGDHGPKWIRGTANVMSNSQYRIVFEAVRGSSYSSDIALDDISMTSSCGTKVPVLVVPVTTPPVCDFEQQGFCSWTNDFFNDLDWAIVQASSYRFSYTPHLDHTLSNSSGHFIIIRTSYYATTDIGWFISPVMKYSLSMCYVTFYYHMTGRSSVGNLTLYQAPVDKDGQPMTDSMSTLAYYQGNAGSAWLLSRNKIKNMATNFVLIFEGSRGFGYGGHVAVDDIGFQPCSPG